MGGRRVGFDGWRGAGKKGAIGGRTVPAVAEFSDVGEEVADLDLGFDDAEMLVDVLSVVSFNF